MENPTVTSNLKPVVYPRQKTRLLVGMVSVLGGIILGSLFASSHVSLAMILPMIIAPLLYRAFWARTNATFERLMLLACLSALAFFAVMIVTFATRSGWRWATFFFCLSPAMVFVAGSYIALERRWSSTGSISPLPKDKKYPTADFWLTHLCFINFLAWVVFHGTIVAIDATAALMFLWLVLPALFNWLLYSGALVCLRYFPEKETVHQESTASSITPEIGKQEIFLRGQVYCVATIFIIYTLPGALFDHTGNEDQSLMGQLANLMTAILLSVGTVWILYHLWLKPSPRTDRLTLGLLTGALFILPTLIVNVLLGSLIDGPAVSWITVLILIPFHARFYRHMEMKWAKSNILPPMNDEAFWPAKKAWLAFIYTWVILSWITELCGLTGMEDEDMLHSDFWGLMLPFALSVLICRTLYKNYLGPETAIFHLKSWKT